MNVVLVVALAVFFVGALVVLAGYLVKRRMDRWADTMIASFGLMSIADGLGQESLWEESRQPGRATLRVAMSLLSSIRHGMLSRVRLLRLKRAAT